MPAVKEKIDDYLSTKLWGTDLASSGILKSFWIKSLRFLYVLLFDLSQEQLALRAMGLVYITLLSVVPLLAVSFSVLKAFGVHTRFEIFLYYFLEPLGEKGVDLSLKIIGFVENINANVLGSIGLAMLVYTVMSQIQKVESALNDIWGVKDTRSFEKRFSNYLSVVLIGPLLIFSAIGITGSLMSTTVVQKVLSIKSLGMALYIAGLLVPYILASAAFTFIYIFLPNTRVRFSAALTGGIFAGIAWKVMGMVFTSFLTSSAKYSAIYSGFSILVLTLIWLYWSWFILFVGAKIAYYQQYPGLLHFRKDPLSLSNRAKEKLVLLIMFHIGSNFHRNLPSWKLESLSGQLKLPAVIVREMLIMLEKQGLIVPTHEEPPAYLPAKDPEIIPIKEILDVVRVSADERLAEDTFITTPEIDGLMNKLDNTVSQSVGNETLKSLIARAEKSGT
jgi:membrane protein